MAALLLTAVLGAMEATESSYYCGNVQATLGPWLTGRVVVPSDNGTYEEAVHQYAYSSMPSALHPSAVVYAEGVRDVERAVQFAAMCRYRVVPRSGGHQYMGLSSCDSSVHRCMQIDMSHFITLAINGTTIRAGAGVSLMELYTTLSQNGLFIGGGECGTVHVGGHVQTGGYGILGRSFGALADNVVGFDIVLSDGRMHHVAKPAATQVNSREGKLFWAVLGGGAGSWGVVTEYVLQARRDADYPHSTYYTCSVPWGREVFADMVGAMHTVSADPTWDTNYNEALWLTIVKRAPFDTNLVHFEGIWVGLDNTPFNNASYSAFVDAVGGRGVCVSVALPVSVMMAQYFTFTKTREFPLPYLKRNQASAAKELGDGFGEVLSEQLDAVMAVPGLFMMTQLVTSGGVILDMEDSSDIALPLRSARYNLDVGVFYSEQMNPVAKQAAADYQEAAWGLIKAEPAFQEDLRYVWATFGNVNIEEVWPYYYETERRYWKLREVKTMVDPRDVFRSSFTIPSLTRGLP
eukprot:TRINITY_DN14901_c0_g1_i1.p1 TRINITY_DN14901_c0_g1~~TRINITY_DN14901_c0_g1_i1.p1  ORF type:complete len:520 (+),score=177.90 TRINITY_DN14901_c0_g1_i1:63-1622(+)